jgi:hypothetical protein
VELDSSVLAVDLGPRPQQAAEQLARLGIGERVVDLDPADLADDRLVARRPVVVGGEQQLVDVMRPAREACLDQRGVECGWAIEQLEHVEHVDLRDIARLGAEPSAPEQPLGELCLVEGGQIRACHC